MKITPLIFTFFISIVCAAQDFAPVGAQWHYQNFSMGGPISSYFTIEADRDTTINGNLCVILEKDTGLIVSGAQLIIWEDNNKVYFFENNQFKLLYDFNLNIGDTLNYYIPYNYAHYNLVCGIGSDTSKIARSIIDSTKQITIDSQNLKRLYTSPIHPNNNTYLQWDLNEITERIGSSLGFLGYPLNQCLGGFPGHFRCYSDNLISYKPVSEDCDYATSIDNYEMNGSLTISPNPTSSHFTIKGVDKPYEVFIYNAVGQIIYSEDNIKGIKTIDASNYSKGLLFIRIESKEEAYYQKIIKQ